MVFLNKNCCDTQRVPSGYHEILKKIVSMHFEKIVMPFVVLCYVGIYTFQNGCWGTMLCKATYTTTLIKKLHMLLGYDCII